MRLGIDGLWTFVVHPHPAIRLVHVGLANGRVRWCLSAASGSNAHQAGRNILAQADRHCQPLDCCSKADQDSLDNRQ